MTDPYIPRSLGMNVLDAYKPLDQEALRALCVEDRLPFAVLCLNLEYDLNIGNTLRTAHLLGARDVFIVGTHKVDTRACVGAHNHTPPTKFKIPPGMPTRDAVMHVLNQQYRPVFIEKTETSRDIRHLPGLVAVSPVPLCLVFGNENQGISEDVIDQDPVFHIPQRGVMRSLNVSSASAIAMWEVARALTPIDPL